MTNAYDVLIVGGGAAAWSAAMYARRYNLTVLVVSEQFGGETALAGLIENYPGVPRIDGFDLMEQMRTQAESLGAELAEGQATLLTNRSHCFLVQVGRNRFEARTIILATGMEHRRLGLPNEEKLKGKGIHYCATCDGPLFKGKRVGVVGGGDSAVKWANQLSDMGAATVTLIVREKNIGRAEPINRQRLDAKKNVTVLLENEVAALIGTDRLTAVQLKRPVAGTDRLPLDGLFVAIGAVPRSTLPKALGVRLNARGEIAVDPHTMATTLDGVFAAGDVCDASGAFKQIVTGAAQGAIAATSAYHDVAEHPNVCALHAVPIAGLLPARTKSLRPRQKGKTTKKKKK